jgi:hypothetical protein
MLSLEGQKESKMFSLTKTIKHHSRSPSQCNRKRKQNRSYTNGKEIKLSLQMTDVSVSSLQFKKSYSYG